MRAAKQRTTGHQGQRRGRLGARWAACCVLATVGLGVGTAGLAGAATTTDSSSMVPPTVQVVSGSLQSTKVGSAFAEPLTLSVTCAGSPVQGATVLFEAPSSGASALFVTSQEVVEEVQTDSSGSASSGELEANDLIGTYQVTATATVPSTPSTSCAGQSASVGFSLTNVAGNPSSVTEVSGSGQEAAVGTTFPDPLVVSVADQDGNPVSGATVDFVVEANDGATATFATGGGQASAVTASDGQASSPALEAGTTAGSFTVLAEVSGTSGPAVFTLTDLPGPPATVTAGVGADQQTTVGSAFPIPLAVTVRDADDNPVPDVSVTFSAPTSGASGTFAGGGTSVSVTTNGDGVAVAPTFSANQQPGGYVVEATAPGVAPAVFALVNEEPPPAPPSAATTTTGTSQASGGAGTSVVGMVVDPATGGYWLVGADGAVFSFDAPYLGGANTVPGGPGSAVVGAGALPSGEGYWEVTAAGAVFSFGQAPYRGGANTL